MVAKEKAALQRPEAERARLCGTSLLPPQVQLMLMRGKSLQSQREPVSPEGRAVQITVALSTF